MNATDSPPGTDTPAPDGEVGERDPRLSARYHNGHGLELELGSAQP